MKLQNPIYIADHELTITGRVVRLVGKGDFLEEHARRYAELLDAAMPPGEPYCSIADARNLNHIGPDARRYLSKWHKGHRCERFAVIGATLLVQGILSLASRAVILFGGASLVLRFFANEADAEAWITDWQDTRPGKP